MTGNLRSLLFFTLVFISLILIVIKLSDIRSHFSTDIESQTAADNLPVVADTDQTFEQQQILLHAKEAELRELQAEIEDKLDALRQAEANFNQLIKQNPEDDNSDNLPVIIEIQNNDE